MQKITRRPKIRMLTNNIRYSQTGSNFCVRKEKTVMNFFTKRRIIVLLIVVICGGILGRMAVRVSLNLLLGGSLFGGNFL